MQWSSKNTGFNKSTSNSLKMFILNGFYLLYLFIYVADAQTQNLNVSENPFTEHNHKAPVISVSRSTRTKWDVYRAQVDNFNPKDTRTFDMRYNYNMELCKIAGCPLVIYVGGEWTISEGWLETGQIYDIARDIGGAMFYTEHRFYGKSIPTPDFSSENLKLLDSSQAMEDLKGFITMLKLRDNFKNSRVFLFGCSYTASLVVWAKQRFPELIHATYSTSGPFYAKDSMFEYLQVISRVIYNFPNVGKQCYNDLFYGIQELEKEYDSGPEGVKSVLNKLRICPPRQTKNKDYDKAAVFQNIGIEFGNMGQTEPEKLPGACTTLINSAGKTAGERLSNYRKQKFPKNCFYSDYYSILSRYTNTTLTGGTSRAWFYQQCNEFGWYQTTETNTQVFGKSVLPFFYHQQCRDAYGNRFTDQVLLKNQENINKERGGRTPNVRKSVFVYGSVDPWAPLGIDKSLNNEALRFWVKEGNHCWDMFPAGSSKDSPSLAEVRTSTRAWIKKWMTEP